MAALLLRVCIQWCLSCCRQTPMCRCTITTPNRRSRQNSTGTGSLRYVCQRNQRHNARLPPPTYRKTLPVPLSCGITKNGEGLRHQRDLKLQKPNGRDRLHGSQHGRDTDGMELNSVMRQDSHPAVHVPYGKTYLYALFLRTVHRSIQWHSWGV